jgi:hypothetical protein
VHALKNTSSEHSSVLTATEEIELKLARSSRALTHQKSEYNKATTLLLVLWPIMRDFL